LHNKRPVTTAPRSGATICRWHSLTLNNKRLLELLRETGEEPIPFAELHAGGISFPATVTSELELNGYPIERVDEHGRLVGTRLLDSEPRDTPAAHRRRRRPRAHR
jgi:hypothetical protein